MRFTATRHEHDGEYAEVFEAESWLDAESVCAKNGWTLDGELMHEGVLDADHPLPSLEVH